MWIRSQDKECLVNCICDDVNYLSVDELDVCYGKIGNMYIILGAYSTKEKAMKVLDMIQEKICHRYVDSIIDDLDIGNFEAIFERGVFEMPKDEEVKI